ncbi:MAG: ferritin-like domain-containing protein [Proteobacteria bacterium]|nr:ferritin-like domain-containing protein [Pseudomonadota bacterium]
MPTSNPEHGRPADWGDITLTQAACRILETASPAAKSIRSRETAAAWRHGAIAEIGAVPPPDRPARPDHPVLKHPSEMPRRRGAAGRVALLHAIAHIELNAIDLAWDMIARFASPDLPRAFYDDWVMVGDEEAKHFTLLSTRLAELEAAYGDLPAHDGLWQSAQETAHDVLARLAVAPLVLEARGLDVTPVMIEKLDKAGDIESARILRIILAEEVGHVAAGWRWFGHIATARGLDPAPAFQALVRRYYRGTVRPPFNRASREAAGFSAAWYEPLAEPESPA